MGSILFKLRLTAWLALAVGLLLPHAALGAGNGSFGATGAMGTARYGAAAAPLPDGRVLVAGGYNDEGGGHYLASAEAFNPSTNAFSSTGIGAMSTARRGAVAAPLPDGRVLVAGGSYDDGTEHSLASAEVFNPATGAFTPVSSMTVARVRAAAAPLPDGRVLVAGGNNGSTRLLSAEVFTPSTGAFTPVNDMTADRAREAAAPLPDGRVLVAGGAAGANGAALQSAEVFNPATKSFSSAGIGAMGTARRAPAAAPLPDGRVLVAGGSNGDFGEHYLSSAEVFNPSTNSFSSVGIGAMGTARTGAVAAPLPDGRVLLAGGFDGSTRFSSAEIFAATNAFSFAVKGRKLLMSVQATGKVSVSDAAARLGASAVKRKKQRLLLAPSDGSGNPPTFTVPLHLSKLAKQRMRRTGRVAMRARITFVPQGGLASMQTAKLRLKGKKKH
ncbi:MAG TPA: kelch repeat-containing protein [Solirubrobacterales bacterium]|nr:kelch repeat-containing protein [Solirubrobacterales bacterium]